MIGNILSVILIVLGSLVALCIYVTKILSAFSEYIPKSISDSNFFKLEANLEKIVQEIQKGK